MGLISDTLATDVRAARRALWSLCTPRAWSEVEVEVAAQLESDNEIVYLGIGIDSEAESPPLSPVAERPRLEESWVDSHRESSYEEEWV